MLIEKEYLSGSTSKVYIPLSKIKEVIIFERLTAFSVYALMAIVLKKNYGKLQLIFESIPLKHTQLLDILYPVRELLNLGGLKK